MAFTLEAVGTKFADWTVIKHLKKTNKHNMRMVKARCACRAVHTVILANLRAGVSKSCQKCAGRKNYEAQIRPINAILRREHVAEIKRRMTFETVSLRQISRDYGMSYNLIWRIKHNQRWTSIPWPKA